MAHSRQNLVQDKIGDLTRCSICTEIFTNPKILPCVHTFCLNCLESYGKDKKPGDQITCPICRSNVTIPDGGLCNLPNNFFIQEMVEIGKLTLPPVTGAKCNICPEGEELVGTMYCLDCEQILCEHCNKSHKRTKFSQHHQVVELGSRLSAKEFNLRKSYCAHHTKKLLKMFCHKDNVAICLVCFAENHQSHRCSNVDTASGGFTERLKGDLKKVAKKLQEYEQVEQKLEKHKNEFLEQISETEESIRSTGTKLKMQIDQHTEILVEKLKLLREQNLNVFEMAKQDVDRYRIMIGSFSTYCEELLSNGSSVDICRAANHMHARANELEKRPADYNRGRFHCDTVVFHPSGFQDFVRQCKSNNAVGDLTVANSQVPIKNVESESLGALHRKSPMAGIMQINVREAGKRHHTCSSVKLRQNATVSELYRIISKHFYHEKVRPEGMRLFFAGKLLEFNEGKAVKDFKMVHQSTVTIHRLS